MKIKTFLATITLTLGSSITAQAIQPANSPFFYNKKADAKNSTLQGSSNSTAKWSVSAKGNYEVFVNIPANANTAVVTYRIYPNGNSKKPDAECSEINAATPCFEVTVDQETNKGKEIQLVSGSRKLWKFVSGGFVSVDASGNTPGEIIGLSTVRFSEPAYVPKYTKISNSGKKLPESAILGSGESDWACTLDNHSGVTWEVQTKDGGLRDSSYFYSWYNPDAKTNGGDAGKKNGGACANNVSCDTDGYIKIVNKMKLCGYNDWRLPNVKEVMNIMAPSYLDYSTGSGAIDTAYFPNSAIDRLWTSETSNENNTQGMFVVLTNAYGFAPKEDGAGLFHIRLVRGK